MGRVLIYSLPSCSACRSVKALLASHGAAYEDIDVGAVPARAAEAAAASGLGSVPQVFFNARLVGGYSEIMELEVSGKLGRMLTEVLDAPLPAGAPMSAAEWAEAHGGEGAGGDEEPDVGPVHEPRDAWLEAVAAAMRRGVGVRDRRGGVLGLSAVPRCFTGAEGVEWLAARVDDRTDVATASAAAAAATAAGAGGGATTDAGGGGGGAVTAARSQPALRGAPERRAAAAGLGQRLLDARLVCHVSKKEPRFLDDPTALYRFQADESTVVLNVARAFMGEVRGLL